MQRTSAVVLVALLGLAGCPKDSSNPASASGFADDMMAAFAAKRAECSPVTADLARQETLLILQADAVAEAQRAGRVGLDESKARECLSWIEAADCSVLERKGGPVECLSAFVPKVHEGGACTLFVDTGLTAECIAGECVAYSDFSCTMTGMCKTLASEGEPCGVPVADRDCAQGFECVGHTCVAWTPVVVHDQVDDPCDFTGNVICADDLYCAEGMTAATCQARAAEGEDCTATPCVKGTSCDGAQCVAWKGVDADCVPGDHECVGGAFCDAATSTCAAFPTVGGECGYTAQGEYRTCIDSWCEIAAPPPPPPALVAALPPVGACRAFLAEGATCHPMPIDATRPAAAAVGFSWDECGPGRLCDPETSTCVAYYCPIFR